MALDSLRGKTSAPSCPPNSPGTASEIHAEHPLQRRARDRLKARLSGETLALAAVTSAGPILVLALALGRGATDNVTLVVIEALG